jgi:hypothetical protein
MRAHKKRLGTFGAGGFHCNLLVYELHSLVEPAVLTMGLHSASLDSACRSPLSIKQGGLKILKG